MSDRPVIGVTTSDLRGWRMWTAQRFAIWRAGGRAVRLMAMHVDDPGAAAKRLDGLVIGGGDDISAHLYGGQLVPDVRIDLDRDALELSLLKALAPTEVPVLGVCRGSQIINTWLGGSLVQDIYEEYEGLPKMRTVLPRKRVRIEPDCRLRAILGRPRLKVNSLHHQAVQELGSGLRAVVHDQYGVIQGIESIGERFLLGVQWHPEFLPQSQPQQRLYRALVAQARPQRLIRHAGGSIAA